MTNGTQLSEAIRGRLIVSCQASPGDAFYSPESMARFAAAARAGGAAAIRANGAEDIAAIVRETGLPVIGIRKRTMADGRVLITPSFEDARALVEAGAAAVALDCTERGQRMGAFERLRRIRTELGVPVCADIATEEEAQAAAACGADFVLSTMRGYTDETAGIRRFQPGFIARLVRDVPAPVIAEGMIATPEEARAAMEAGALAVIVGTAITRPHEITRLFARAVQPPRPCAVAGIDLGATNTKYGLVDEAGRILWSAVEPTPAKEGAEALLRHLVHCVAEVQRRNEKIEAVGIAAAGWPQRESGRIAWATGGIPGWTGAEVGRTVADAARLPVIVENDARAMAEGERRFGAAKGVRDFLCLTLGTGVGGGAVVDGRLLDGASALGGALGHIPVEPDGEPCACGARGCLEAYASAEALLRHAAPARFESARELIDASRQGDPDARRALSTYAAWLGRGIASLVNIFDPELVILGGGLVQDNAELMETAAREAVGRIFARDARRLRVEASPLGYEAGLLGAAALALEAAKEN
mgnify:CR=1 FL=1